MASSSSRLAGGWMALNVQRARSSGAMSVRTADAAASRPISAPRVSRILVRHGDGQVLGYFLEPEHRSRPLTSSFGMANWAGLLATTIAIAIVAISSDAALRRLKAARWKRWNYALAVVHALLYGAPWRLTSPYTATPARHRHDRRHRSGGGCAHVASPACWPGRRRLILTHP